MILLIINNSLVKKKIERIFFCVYRSGWQNRNEKVRNTKRLKHYIYAKRDRYYGGGGIIDKCKYSLSNVRVDSRISVTIILV